MRASCRHAVLLEISRRRHCFSSLSHIWIALSSKSHVRSLHNLGYDGGPGGGDGDTVFVYAYLKTSSTVE